MDYTTFLLRITDELIGAVKELGNDVKLDYRAFKYTGDEEEYCIFSLDELADLWDWLTTGDSDLWFVDIYENHPEKNQAFFTDHCVKSTDER